MPNRIFSSLVVLLWMGSMTALFVRDVWPAWTAQDLPPVCSADVFDGIDRNQQYGMFVGAGGRIGTSWTRFRSITDVQTIEMTHFIERIGDFGPIRIETDLRFSADQGRLEEFSVRLHGAPQPIQIEGERIGDEIVCNIHAGTTRRAFHVNAAVAGMIGESLRPFSVLPDIHVGQTWRVYMLDPLSLLLGGKTAPRPLLVRVTGRETITIRGTPTEMFVVEWPSSRSWVDDRGRVIRTQIDVPLIGRLTVLAEPFSDSDLRAARERVPIVYNSAAHRNTTGGDS